MRIQTTNKIFEYKNYYIRNNVSETLNVAPVLIKKQCLTKVNGANLLPLAPIAPIKTVHFRGKIVHIVDGGIHACHMEHFAKFLRKDLEINMHNVEINSKDKYTKQLKSMEQQLKKLNQERNIFNKYVAIPGLSSVPLLNLQDQYNRIMNRNEKFTPENIKSKKNELMSFLKKIYESPLQYKTYIGYMDTIDQGIEYTFGIIKEINQLVKNGAKVYIPSGHPNDATLKWMAQERGLKPELYHYIATGQDVNSSVKNMINEINDKNWYNFNLLSLSDATVVGLKDKTWEKDYIFSAFDSCVNDSARGVYNLTPVRNNDKIIGYSFSDKNTVDYPYDEFPMNKEVSNIVFFVGRDKEQVVANSQETRSFLSVRNNLILYNKLPNLLYNVNDIFSLEEIKKNKIELQGKYVDKSLKLFFDENNEGKIVFKKCDCEASGRPSVLSVWGSCYAVFNAISRDIGLEEEYINPTSKLVQILDTNKKYDYKTTNKIKYELSLKQATEIEKVMSRIPTERKNEIRVEPYIMLGELYESQQKYNEALGCYNRAIDILSEILYKYRNEKITKFVDDYNKYVYSKDVSEEYDREINWYNSLLFFEKFFEKKPVMPKEYNNYRTYDYSDYQKYVLNIKTLYEKIANICHIKQEYIPEKICRQVAKDIKSGRAIANKVLERRMDKNHYIGDLYNAIK